MDDALRPHQLGGATDQPAARGRALRAQTSHLTSITPGLWTWKSIFCSLKSRS
jgi:hypothetical protein